MSDDDNVVSMTVAPDGRWRYGAEPTWKAMALDPPERCRDCGVNLGGEHHEHCCIALCATCNGQRIGGGCSCP